MRTVEQLIALIPSAAYGRVPIAFDIVFAIDDTSDYDAAMETLSKFGGDAVAFWISDVLGEHRMRVAFKGGERGADAMILFNLIRGVA